MRVGEIGRVERNDISLTHYRLAPLVLLEGEVHTRPAQFLERRLEPLAANRRLDVAELALRQTQQRQVGAARVGKDAAAQHPKEIILALREPPAYGGTRLLEGDPAAQKTREPEDETPVHLQVRQHAHDLALRRGA